MKAPDKVYIDDLAVVNDCVTKISLKQLPNFSEYIRKDALLEWAKTKLSHIQEDFDVYTGQRIMLRELIEKIESL